MSNSSSQVRASPRHQEAGPLQDSGTIWKDHSATAWSCSWTLFRASCRAPELRSASHHPATSTSYQQHDALSLCFTALEIFFSKSTQRSLTPQKPKSDPGFESGFLDYSGSGSGCLLDCSQNVLDALSCRRESFRQVPYRNEKLSCRRETAQCFVSLKILLSHSRSFEITPLSGVCVSLY